MNIRLFPGGRVHSAYLDLVKYPPQGFNYIGNFSYAVGTSVDFFGKNIAVSVADYLNLPYVFLLKSDCSIHSCQKLLKTNANYVIDIEHGNPFVGANNIFKYNYLSFRWLTKKILMQDNCKMILPWTETAKNAFCLNFDFLGRDFLKNKLRVVYPATFSFDKNSDKFDIFTFIFVAGRSFYAKGGLQTLEAFKKLLEGGIKANLIVVGATPEDERLKYAKTKGFMFYPHIDRDELLNMLAKCHCLVLPSMGDTFGMIIIEAKARGIPAIVVDSFSAKEMVEDNITGYVIDPDPKIIPWFDEHGRKRINKTQFHEQFGRYSPSGGHVMKLCNTMEKLIYSPNRTKIMGKNAKKETEDGKFSIKVRNKALKEIYEGL